MREVFEETGLEVEPTALCGVLGGREFRVRYRNGDQVEYTMAVFVCRVRGGRLRLDGEESLDLRWVARDELATLDVAPWAQLLLERVFEAPGEALLQPVRWRPPAVLKRRRAGRRHRRSCSGRGARRSRGCRRLPWMPKSIQ